MNGHPGLEYALCRLSDATGDARYARLAQWFVRNQHTQMENRRDYNQSERPAVEMTDAAQVVLLEKPVRGTFFTLQVLSTYDANNLASIAEFDFLGADGNPLTSVDMQISGVDSEEEVRDDGIAENAIDGQVEAYWLSSSRTLPHWIEFRVSDKTQIHGFRYTPRQGNGIGRIKDWKLHVR